MKKTNLLIIPITVAIAALTSCEVKKTQDGELPDVKVDVDGGKLPKYDVDAPDVDIEMKEKTIKVPTLDVDSAAEDEKEDGTD